MTARPLTIVGALMATFAATVLVNVSPAVAVSTDQSYWMPVDHQVVVRGHGYGHGHGMSQYGAQGAALKGLGYRKIIDFYYPGTSWSKVRGNVRVLISSDTTSDVVVSPAEGLTLRDLGDKTTYALPDINGVTRWRINVGAHNTNVVGYLTNRWHRWSPKSEGSPGKTSLVGDGEFFAKTPLKLWTPSGAKIYRGMLRAASPSKGSSYRDTVNVVSMDQYVKGVVPYEMPASWHPEAVKAQAVAARTYATWSRNQNASRYYQICDTTSCQVYGGANGEDARSNVAVNATARQILTYAGKAAFTQYASSSGGWTSPGGVPYLRAQADPYDAWAGNPVHDWTLTIDAGRFERAYPSIGTLRRLHVVSRDGNGEWNGRVLSVVLDGTRSNQTISGDSVRAMFGLRSSWFTIDPTPIISRWTRLGGAKSVLGTVKSGEYRVENGSAQTFDSGRIFYSSSTGARELYGLILGRYRAQGGPGSALGLPITPIQVRKTGFRAKFQGGIVWTNAGTGTVPVLGRIAQRYLSERGLNSGLGWPTATNVTTKRGERVNFQHGYISWFKDTNETRMRITG